MSSSCPSARVRFRCRSLPGVPSLAVAFAAVALGGCDDLVGSDDATPRFEVTELAEVGTADDVVPLDLNESGHALWLRNDRPVLWDGGLVTFPEEITAHYRRIFLAPDGRVLLRDLPRTLLLSPGGIVELEGTPLGFTRDGGAHVLIAGEIHVWRDGALHPTTLPPGQYIGPDGAVYDYGWESDLKGIPFDGWCSVNRDGVETILWESGGACIVFALGGRGTSVLEAQPHVVVIADGRTRTTSEMEWDLPAGSDVETLVSGSRFFDVNASGTTVGTFHWPTNPSVLFQEGGVVRDLNALTPADGWVLETARAINDAGDILALGRSDDGRRAVLLLTRRR